MILFAVPTVNTDAHAHDIPASEFDSSEFSELTYGIYWYQSGSNVPVAANKATNFDPTKPTLIYAHGMKFDHEGLDCREGLSLKDNNYENMVGVAKLDPYRYEEEFYQPLIDQGYNVGVFYWNQLADCLFKEEIKFWVTTDADGKLCTTFSYIDQNGKYKTTSWTDERNPEHTVTYLYRDCLVNALGKDFSGHLQLVGHSMGGQLTLAVSQALCSAYDRGEISANYLPDRVTLLDPYLGSRLCSGTVDTTGEVIPADQPKSAARLAAEAAKNVSDHGIPIEAYGANESMVYRYYDSPASLVTGQPLPKEETKKITKLFTDNIAWVYLKEMYNLYVRYASGNLLDIFAKPFIPTHTMTVDYYFTTMYLSPVEDNGGVEVPSFKASDDHIRALKGVAFAQMNNPSITNGNPIYQNETSFVRVDSVTYKEIYPSDIPSCLSGTIAETEKSLDVKLLSDGKEVATVKSLKGKFFFSGVTAGNYSIVVYDGGTAVCDPVEVSVGYDEITTIREKINAVALKNETKPLIKDVKIFAVCIGAAIIVLICLLVALKRKNARI